MLATPNSSAATGTRRSPASSAERFCRMHRAAPVVCVWVVMSLSCRSLSSSRPLLSGELSACRVVRVMLVLLAQWASRSVGSGSVPALHSFQQETPVQTAKPLAGVLSIPEQGGNWGHRAREQVTAPLRLGAVCAAPARAAPARG